MSRLLLPLLCCLAASACASFAKDYPDKVFYAFDVERAEQEDAPQDAPLLQIKRFRAGPMNESRGLIYRTAPSTYETDYYSEFFSAPESLLSVAAGAWLSDSGSFRVIVGESGDLEPDFVLHGALRSLYVDLAGDDGPRAHVGLQCFLSRREHGVSVALWRKDFARSELAEGASGAEVLAAWNRALAGLFAELEGELDAAILAAD